MDINYDKLFRFMCKNGYLNDVKKLYNLKPNIDISTINERVFILSCIKDHLVLAKWLLEIKPTIDINSSININDINNQTVIKWLLSLNNHGLTYKIIDGKYTLYKQIKTIKKENIVFYDKCCVCSEKTH